VPARHAFSPVSMDSSALAMGADARVVELPEDVEAAGCPDWHCAPDWATLQLLDYASSAARAVFRVYCEIRKGATADAEPLGACPRYAARKIVDALFAAHGLEMLAASEPEFVAAREPSPGDFAPLFSGVDVFSTLRLAAHDDIAYDVFEAMDALGVDVRSLHAGRGPGAFEAAFGKKRGLAAADDASTFRTGVKEVLLRRGLVATFHSAPFRGAGGGGGPLTFSLWRGQESAQHDPADADGLAATARSFLAGVLAHAAALEAFAAPTPACYARRGGRAPTKADYSFEDASACVRVSSRPGGDAAASHFEYRAPSSAANAYLVLAAVAAAGADGVARGLALGPPGTAGAADLPTSLEASLDALHADPVVAGALGDDLCEWFDLVKRGELRFIRSQVDATIALDDDAARRRAWSALFFRYV